MSWREDLYQDLVKACKCAKPNRNYAAARKLVSACWKTARTAHKKNDHAFKKEITREIKKYIKQYEKCQENKRGTFSLVPVFGNIFLKTK